jgi:endonuclease/exonuclease/phosphatase family metal-dependent hydrolase
VWALVSERSIVARLDPRRVGGLQWGVTLTTTKTTKIALTLALCGLLLGGSGCGDDGSGAPASFSLATFNVRNFFDAADDPLKLDDVPGVLEVSDKVKSLGTALRVLGADVIALQEVENKALLDRLRREQLADQGYTELRLIEGNDPRGIDVALLSRFAVTREVSHIADRFPGVDGDTATHRFSRDCLEVDLEIAGRKLTLLVNHLRAATGGSSDTARRRAQAARVREIADAAIAASPSGLLAVVGDLNADPQSRTLELLATGSGGALVDVLEGRPSSERVTVTWNDKIQVDYLLLSPQLRAALEASSAAVIRTQIFSDTSDHLPVKAEFTLP